MSKKKTAVVEEPGRECCSKHSEFTLPAVFKGPGGEVVFKLEINSETGLPVIWFCEPSDQSFMEVGLMLSERIRPGFGQPSISIVTRRTNTSGVQKKYRLQTV